MIIGKLVSEGVPDAFILFYLGAWTFGGLLAILLWLWNNRGREIVRVSDNELIRIRDYVWFMRSRRFQLRHIRNMRLDEIDLSLPELNRGSEFWGLSGGTVAFDYGSGVGKLALGVGEKEAIEIILAIKGRFPDV